MATSTRSAWLYEYGRLRAGRGSRRRTAGEGRASRSRRDIGAPLPEGYESEVYLGLGPWIAALAGCARARRRCCSSTTACRGASTTRPSAPRGTLLCHFRHRFHDDALARVGLQDITAWVDFTAVADAAQAAGLEVAGYTTQAHFLIGCGLGEFVANVADLDLVDRVNLSRQAMMLTLPGEMGERFKAIALAKGFEMPLRGFAVRDLRHTL